MAIYHLHIDSYRRSRGRTAVGGMAYRRGLKVGCRHSGKRYNFRGKDEVAYSGFVPVDGDKTDYSKLENLVRLYESVEEQETHCRATVGREIEAALPNELNQAKQVELVLGFIQSVKQAADAERAFFDFSIHAKPNNPHVHICMAEREQLSPFVFSKTKRRHWDGKDFVKLCRQIWEQHTNAALEAAGINQRVDSRSYAEREIAILPMMHEGRAAYFNSEVKTMNDTIKQTNEEIKEKQESKRLAAGIKPLTKITPPDKQDEFTASSGIPDEDWSMSCEDDPSAPAIRRLLKEKYQYSLGFSKYIARVEIKGSYAVLTFKDKSQIFDQGSRIISEGSNSELAAYRLVELALAKQWQKVSFTGDEQFLRDAFERALDSGLEVQAKNEAQQILLDEIKRDKQGLASAMTVSPGNQVTVPLNDIRKKGLQSKLVSGTSKPKNKKWGWRRSGT
jgi:hypothetical protein